MIVDFNQGGTQYAANNKIYLQGNKLLISEPGEWALDSATQTLYYWPRDADSMAAGTLSVVATTTQRVIDFRGETWDPSGVVTGVDVSGLVLSGSDFAANFTLFKRTNDTPLKYREAMVRFENATDCGLIDCALLDAGHSAVWMQGFTQNHTVTGNRIERPVRTQAICCCLCFMGVFWQIACDYRGSAGSSSKGSIR